MFEDAPCLDMPNFVFTLNQEFINFLAQLWWMVNDAIMHGNFGAVKEIFNWLLQFFTA